MLRTNQSRGLSQATFLMRARGESMKDAGTFDGDVLLVDRALTPRNGNVVVAVIDGEFVCKSLWLRSGRPVVMMSNNDGCAIAHSNEASR